MKHHHSIGAVLRGADPVASDPGLPADAVADMRARVLISAGTPAAPRTPRVLVLATATALLAIVVVVAVHKPAAPPAPAAAARPATDPPRRTQVYFSTPGGTRIIWTIDPAFQLKGARR